MFALVFRFPHGRYHATPWGRHVNEGAVAWPPEPYRLLRALIAVWHRKAERERWPTGVLDRLIEALAETTPVYALPEAVHAHTRHYMPQGDIKEGRERTSLVFDAFYRIDPGADLIAAWPELTLDDEALALAEHLAERMGYLGRAESIVIAHTSTDPELAKECVVKPVSEGCAPPQAGWSTTDVLGPLSCAAYAELRTAFGSKNKGLASTLPATLTDALQVETSQLQKAGWSRPPAGRIIVYARPEVGPRPPASPPRRSPAVDPKPQVARLILAGRPRPSIVDSIRIGEVFRRALMARLRDAIPPVILGRDETGAPLRDPGHGHAFYLPEDADGDGHIDHLVLYARDGLPREVRRALESLTSLWIADRKPADTDDEEADAGRRTWRLALEGYGPPTEFNDSPLLTCSRRWISATPYLRPRHLKRGDSMEAAFAMVERECATRGWPVPDVDTLSTGGDRPGRDIMVGGQRRNTLAFHRFRSRRGLVQPDRAGLALALTFPKCVQGPIALGFGCHFGLGLFRADQARA